MTSKVINQNQLASCSNNSNPTLKSISVPQLCNSQLSNVSASFNNAKFTKSYNPTTQLYNLVNPACSLDKENVAFLINLSQSLPNQVMIEPFSIQNASFDEMPIIIDASSSSEVAEISIVTKTDDTSTSIKNTKNTDTETTEGKDTQQEATKDNVQTETSVNSDTIEKVRKYEDFFSQGKCYVLSFVKSFFLCNIKTFRVAIICRMLFIIFFAK